MKVERAWAIMQTARDRVPTELGMEEQTELVTEGLLRTITMEQRAALEKEVRDLDQTAAKMRAMSRSGDAPRGRTLPIGGRSSPSGISPEEYRQELHRLESMLLHKATLDCMTYSPKTACYLTLTAEGEKALDDLQAWSHRFGGMELKDLLTRIGGMRAEMSAVVMRANGIANELKGYTYSPFLTSVRAPALVLAERGSTSSRTVNVLLARHFEGRIDGNKLMMASLMGDKVGTGEELAQQYKAMQAKASAYGMTAAEDDFRVNSLVGMSEPEADAALERMRRLKADLSLEDDDLTWLALSGHTVEGAESRYRRLLGGLLSQGVAEDDQLRSATSIMAGSELPEDQLLERFEALLRKLQTSYQSPKAAAAMLAIGPLEPEESLCVLREAVGVVSRSNFFDDAEEVDNLALLLTAGMGPRLVEATAGPLPSTEIMGRAMPANAPPERGRMIARAFIPFWVHRSYNQPTMRRISSHPAHMHTIPYFG